MNVNDALIAQPGSVTRRPAFRLLVACAAFGVLASCASDDDAATAQAPAPVDTSPVAATTLPPNEVATPEAMQPYVDQTVAMPSEPDEDAFCAMPFEGDPTFGGVDIPEDASEEEFLAIVDERLREMNRVAPPEVRSATERLLAAHLATVDDDTISFDNNDFDEEANRTASNDVLVSGDGETEVDGTPTRVLDVRIDPDSNQTTDPAECGGPDQCFWYASVPEVSINPDAAPFRLVPPMVGTHSYRLWHIPVGDLEPIVLAAWAPNTDTGWLDEIEGSLVTSLRVDEPKAPMAVPKSGVTVISD